MSIKTLTDSLKKFVSDHKNFKSRSVQHTRKYLKEFDFVVSNASCLDSLNLTKKIALLCNHNIHKDDGSKLLLAEEMILAWIRSAKSVSEQIPESLLKLLIITYINQSFLYQFVKPGKCVEAVIKATKIPEQFVLRSRKGKLLKFNAMLRLCQIYIFLRKPENGILVAQQVLEKVLKKLENKRNKKLFKEFVMVAVTAFYRIGICEQMQNLPKSAELAFTNANSIIAKYLPITNQILDLDYEAISARPLTSSLTSRLSKPKRFLTPSLLSELPALPSDQLIPKSVIASKKELNSKIPHSQDPPVKFPDRYYSKERLQQLDQMLNEEKKRVILNTDNFFFKKISKDLAINGDLKATALAISQNVNEQLQDVWKNKEMLKKKKKNMHYMTLTALPKQKIQEKIENIQETFESHIKMQDTKMKSKLKTKIYKKLLRSINVPVKSSKNFPTQKLFFRPPEKRLETVVTFTTLHPEREKLFEDAKHEIEEQMEELKKEFEGVAPKAASMVKTGDCQLARSALDNKNSVKAVKKSILRTLGSSSAGILKKSK